MGNIIAAIAVLGALGALFGLILSVASKIFEVKKDPREEAILSHLAGANCGGCGYPGCGGCAAAILAGNAPVTACAPAGPDSAVTRQELAVLLHRYAQYKGGDVAEGTLSLYSDAASISAWAREGMAHAVGLGLIQGSDGRIDPGGAATRSQLAVILQRLMTPAMG